MRGYDSSKTDNLSDHKDLHKFALLSKTERDLLARLCKYFERFCSAYLSS